MDSTEKMTDKHWKRGLIFTLIWFAAAGLVFVVAKSNVFRGAYSLGIHWNEFFSWSTLGVFSYPVALILFFIFTRKVSSILTVIAISSLLTLLMPLSVIGFLWLSYFFVN